MPKSKKLIQGKVQGQHDWRGAGSVENVNRRVKEVDRSQII